MASHRQELLYRRSVELPIWEINRMYALWRQVAIALVLALVFSAVFYVVARP